MRDPTLAIIKMTLNMAEKQTNNLQKNLFTLYQSYVIIALHYITHCLLYRKLVNGRKHVNNLEKNLHEYLLHDVYCNVLT